MYIRKQNFQETGQESFFLWGARQTGKSTLLKELFPDTLWFDLLLSNVYERLQRNPSQLREIILADLKKQPVIIDEIQLIPALLNEVQWLITNQKVRFILCGSSPRKILRSGSNLLGGRALRCELYPLIYHEIHDFDLIRALNHGLLPRHYISANPAKLISAYIGSYLRDEIRAEARIRKITSFSSFLEAAAFSNGEMVNYSNIATDCGISVPTVREYFQILEDTLIGRFLPAFQKKPKRRVIKAPRFYYFDIGIANYLLKRTSILQGSETFGKAFEHFIYHELFSHSRYSGIHYPIYYWLTTSDIEVDFILGDHEVAVEVKATEQVNQRHLKGLNSFAEDYQVRNLILVSNDPVPRRIDEISILPWRVFLDRLWAGEIIS